MGELKRRNIASAAYRRGRVAGQLSWELEGPTGFLEAPYKPDRSALFLSDSSWKQGNRVRYLIRDTPDGFTHEGWSPTAEYRRDGQWTPVSEAPGSDAFTVHPSDWANLRGRWSLAGFPRGAGNSIAAELCNAAIEWWDNHDDGRSQPIEGPDIVDYCAVFPRLSARRNQQESVWHLLYTTDTACWSRFPGRGWSFAGRVSARDKIEAITRQSVAEQAWRHYTQDRRTNQSAVSTDSCRSLHEQEKLAEALAARTEIPLVLPLLRELMAAAPTGLWTFDLLSKYSEFNATAGVDLVEESDVGQLHIQNDLGRWVARGERWVEVQRADQSESTFPIELSQITEAALCLAADSRNVSRYWAEDLQSPQIWVITDTEAKREGDFPIYEVVRGASRQSASGWRFTPGLEWNWQKVEELRQDHHLPRWESDDRDYADTTAVQISDTLSLLLLEYANEDYPRDEEEVPPMWSDFLDWIQAHR
jgi:hypothetical protein